MRFKGFMAIALVFIFLYCSSVYAQVGDLGFFGGITEGRRLPKTTEILLSQTTTSRNRNQTTSLVYKETIFLSGQPVEFEGMLDITPNGSVSDTVDVGTYTVTYRVYASATTQSDVTIDRTINYRVNYRREDKQIILDYDADSWSETITTPDGTFVLDPVQSYFGISIIEDHTPGVVYYKGNVSQRAVYTGDTETVLETSDSFYGYSNAWSSTETHRLDGTVTRDDWQMQYQIRPSVTVGKTLQYSSNEPTAISFSGNYREIMQNQSGYFYDIFVKPKQFTDVADTGGGSIAVHNTFEQLIAPDLNFLKGHFAEEDIKKLFSMQVLDGNPKFYQPNQAITRGQYVTALAKAIKLPIEQTSTTARNRRTQVVNIVFPDVTADRAEYPYIMAAFKAGIAIGRSNGNFYIDSPLEREEAIAILLRSLGLENLSPDPTTVTVYTDDSSINGWAKREIYAANALGIIGSDEDGRIRPKDNVTKAEAAAFINSLIDYMRSGIATDYADHIVNYAD